MKCMVKNCKHNTMHVTSSHMCNKCFCMGHGEIECNNNDLINKLKQYYNDVIENPCNIIYCNNKYHHTNDGHKCIFCNKYGSNHMPRCPENGIPIIDSVSYIPQSDFLQPGEYYEKYIGFDCVLYIRRNKCTSILESLFMHRDHWGKNGDDMNDTPRYKAFIYQYELFRKVG